MKRSSLATHIRDHHFCKVYREPGDVPITSMFLPKQANKKVKKSKAENQEAYKSYWKKGSQLGVIESFMNPQFDLYEGLQDFCFLLFKIGKKRFSQADTERVVKTIRKVEPRFSNYKK